MSLLKTEGVIIKQRDYSEADKLITVYTLEKGKLSCIARGIKKTKSKLRGSLLPFSHSSLILFKGKSLYTITGADVMESFMHLRKDINLMAYTSYILELFDSMVPEEDSNQELFLLLIGTMHILQYVQPQVALKSFEIRFLRMLGYNPGLRSCMKCGAQDNSYRFSSEHGGIFCSKCSNILSNSSIQVRAGTIRALQELDRIHWQKINRLKLSKKDNLELDAIMDDYIQFILQKKLLSREFIKSFIKE